MVFDHESKDCRLLTSNQDAKHGANKKAQKPKGMCYNEGCNEQFTREHKDSCPFRKDKSNHSMNMMDFW